jgi:oligoendopeptidase F
VVPLVRRLDENRRRVMGLEVLRPWDLNVDPHGRDALRPFEGGRQLVAKTRTVFRCLDQRLAGMFDALASRAPLAGGKEDGGMRTECLDLDSRKGKRPGGYQ